MHSDEKFPRLLLQNSLLIGKELPPFGINGWRIFNHSIISVKSARIEQQAPILDAQFFSWFVMYFISPVYNDVLKSKTDVGHDFTWCGAAKLWNNVKSVVFSQNSTTSKETNPACVVILGNNPITHKDFRAINDWRHKTSDWSIRSNVLLLSYQIHFPNSFYNGIYDEEFTQQRSWYSKSSGNCSKAPALKDFPTKILISKQVYDHLATTNSA